MSIKLLPRERYLRTARPSRGNRGGPARRGSRCYELGKLLSDVPACGAIGSITGEDRSVGDIRAHRDLRSVPGAADLIEIQGCGKVPLSVDLRFQIGDLLLRVAMASAPAMKRRGGGSIFADREPPQIAPAAESRVVRLGRKSGPQRLGELINYGRECEISRIAIVGTGLIGSSWIACFLAHGLDVVATDPAPGAEDKVRQHVEGAWAALTKIGLSPGVATSRVRFEPDLKEAVADADLVQENAPEREPVKIKLSRTSIRSSRRLPYWRRVFPVSL